jgi:chlorite dismutase
MKITVSAKPFIGKDGNWYVIVRKESRDVLEFEHIKLGRGHTPDEEVQESAIRALTTFGITRAKARRMLGA